MQTPNAQRKASKVPSITKQELTRYQKAHNSANSIQNQLATVCLEKELALKTVMDNFQKKFDPLHAALTKAVEKREEVFSEIKEVYGQDIQFHIATGVIVNPKQPEAAPN